MKSIYVLDRGSTGAGKYLIPPVARRKERASAEVFEQLHVLRGAGGANVSPAALGTDEGAAGGKGD